MDTNETCNIGEYLVSMDYTLDLLLKEYTLEQRKIPAG